MFILINQEKSIVSHKKQLLTIYQNDFGVCLQSICTKIVQGNNNKNDYMCVLRYIYLQLNINLVFLILKIYS